jgi:hypothetical protein
VYFSRKSEDWLRLQVNITMPLQRRLETKNLNRFKVCSFTATSQKCFALSRSVSEYLQHENMDLVSAVSGVQSLKDSLSSFRNEEKMDQFLQEALNKTARTKD